ncbi:TFIIB-type zinc ribbon-containing protein [Crenobacter luteus]|uniref:Transcription factor zinc-finger domain-containing protein n=1 Tax=Crenobacter luteus TaxID=1452487 RepID=A0A161SEU2_9NEIS|nr:zf-TFIIB domain-containing protein [Crenobacter luteus]KZE35083.1 hypothetical protein AVW16_04665 [Crenobacter luteus]
MHCPVCKDTTLVMSERQGVEIDYCPRCRGVWLDRGELDKIVARAVRELEPAAAPAPGPSPAQGYGGQPPQYGQPPQHAQRPYPPKRKKSFWEELFD